MKTSKLIEKMLHYFRTAGCAESPYKEDIPSFVRFAYHIGADMQTLRAKRKKSKAFEKAWLECEEILSDRIVDGALHKRLDASFSKFLLSARFGYSDKGEEKEGEEHGILITLKEPEKKTE